MISIPADALESSSGNWLSALFATFVVTNTKARFSAEEALSSVTVLFHGNPSKALLHLQSLAECLGLVVEFVDVGSVGLLASVVATLTSQKGAGIVLDVKSLKNTCERDQLKEVATHLCETESAVLLLVSEMDEWASLFLQVLTNDSVRRVVEVGSARRVVFPKDSRVFSGELASHSYSRRPDEALGLTISSEGRADIVMMLDQTPAFAHVCVGRASVFIWSTKEVFDVFQPLPAETGFEDAADKYIPAIIFLRSAFGDQCWHNPDPGAGLVIDDPLLRKNYGFINFQQLLGSARKHGYHITLAFIPWNLWRSRAKNVRMFLEHSDCFSICAHGCDHTKREFRSNDYEALLSKNFVARQRMDHHRDRTGLGIEPLMVCPQEQYSLEAMRAFADSRQFLGLVCTACVPRDLAIPQICGADLLLPAQDSFYGFPVFKRHYWNGMGAFAMALFLGKPAILVEHHEFFRKGVAGAEEFARRLTELQPDLKWKSLAEVVTCTHARRRVTEGRWEVRFFTDLFELKHELEAPTEYRFLRRIPEATVVERVLVGDKVVPFSRENGFLMFEISAYQPQKLSIRVEVAPVRPGNACPSGIKYHASVALRRGLCELRDNVIVRNRFALRAGKLLMRSLKQTSAK